MKNTKKNFTLVELLCAVGLVVILAGIGFSAYSYASYRGKEAATKSLITRLAAGLETLKTKHGFYPSTYNSSGGAGEKRRFAHIEAEMDDNGIIKEIRFIHKSSEIAKISDAKQLKDFLAVADAESLKKHFVKQGDYYDITDSWGGKIYYAHPGFFNAVKFDIITPGADGGFGMTAKEVAADKEDEIPTDSDKYKDDSEWACDDITNFK